MAPCETINSWQRSLISSVLIPIRSLSSIKIKTEAASSQLFLICEISRSDLIEIKLTPYQGNLLKVEYYSSLVMEKIENYIYLHFR